MDVDLRLGGYREALDGETWDSLITDPPYSARTHGGHDTAAKTTERADISYTAWTPEDARAFVEWAHPRTRGWMVMATDHMLAPVFADAMEAAGRYAFSPLAFVETGSRIRLCGDGPAQWAVWLVVSRPRADGWLDDWRTKRRAASLPCALPGAYVDRSGGGKEHIGGKPLRLWTALVRDYTCPGDVVCDPCAGAGTTLLAARALGLDAIGSELDPETHAAALARLGNPQQIRLL